MKAISKQLDSKKQQEKDLELTVAIEAVSTLEEELKKYSIEAIQARIDVLNHLRDQEKKHHGELERLKTELRLKLDKMKKLEDLKYDESCLFCMDNIFVKDAIATKASIETDKSAVIDLSGSSSKIVHVPYEQAFSKHHGDIDMRVPDLTKIKALTGYVPQYRLDDIIKDML